MAKYKIECQVFWTSSCYNEVWVLYERRWFRGWVWLQEFSKKQYAEEYMRKLQDIPSVTYYTKTGLEMY